MGRFYEGQKVVCINDNFPIISTTIQDKSIIGSQAAIHPTKGETLSIDELLGDFLRFNKYDTVNDCNWWHSCKFKPLDEIETSFSFLESEEYKECKKAVSLLSNKPYNISL